MYGSLVLITVKGTGLGLITLGTVLGEGYASSFKAL